MAIEREPNHQRLHHRVTVPLFVSIGGRNYRARDWSLGGFQVTDFAGSETVGDDLHAELILPYAGFKVDLPVDFRIVRRQGSSIGCQYIELGEVPRRALRHLLEASIEGRLADAGDVIGTMHEPVSSAPIEQMLVEEDTTHIYLGKKKLIRTGLFYALLGLMLVGLTGALTYRNAMFIDIPDGIVMGNFVSISTPVSGRLADVLSQEGEFVQEGQPLFRLSNPDLTAAVGAARARLETSRVQAEALRSQLEEEGKRLELLKAVTRRQVGQASAAADAVEAEMEKARIDRARFEKLNAEGVVSDDAAELARSTHESLVARRREMEEELERLSLNLDATDQGRFFSGDEVEGRTRELSNEYAIARARISQAEEDLKIALSALEQTQINSVMDGHVYTVYRHPGELLRPYDVVLSLRGEGGYWAVGRLQGDEAIRIRPGMEVEVLIPSMDLRLEGRVGAIGHQALSTASQSSADMESSLKEVPIKIVLPEVSEEIPPGIRAQIRIYMEPNLKRFKEMRIAQLIYSLWPRHEV